MVNEKVPVTNDIPFRNRPESQRSQTMAIHYIDSE